MAPPAGTDHEGEEERHGRQEVPHVVVVIETEEQTRRVPLARLRRRHLKQEAPEVRHRK